MQYILTEEEMKRLAPIERVQNLEYLNALATEHIQLTRLAERELCSPEIYDEICHRITVGIQEAEDKWKANGIFTEVYERMASR